MKKVTLKEFVTYPEGTIYAPLHAVDGCAGDLARKGESKMTGKFDDFYTTDLTPHRDLDRDYAPGEELVWMTEYCETRWALYDDTFEFLIYEKKDLLALKEMLADAFATLKVEG